VAPVDAGATRSVDRADWYGVADGAEPAPQGGTPRVITPITGGAPVREVQDFNRPWQAVYPAALMPQPKGDGVRYYRPEIKGIDGEVDGYISRRVEVKLSPEHADVVARVQRQLQQDKPIGTGDVTINDTIRHIIASMLES
jgi:hypothetical protein